MKVVIVIILALIGWLYMRYRRQYGFYEVVDENNKSQTFGNYNQCKSWINAQKGMEELSRINKSYRIIKKEF